MSTNAAKPMAKASTRAAVRAKAAEADQLALALHSRGSLPFAGEAKFSDADKADLSRAKLKMATIEELGKLCADWSAVRQHTLPASGAARAELLDIIAHHAAGLKAALGAIDRGDEMAIFSRMTRDELSDFMNGPASVLPLDLQLAEFDKSHRLFIDRLGRLAQYSKEVAAPLRQKGGRPSSVSAAVWFIEQIALIVRDEIDIDPQPRKAKHFDGVVEVCFRVVQIPNGAGGTLAIDEPLRSFRERRAWLNPAQFIKERT